MTELVSSPLGIHPPMMTMLCPPAQFSLPLTIVTQAWYSRPPPKSDHWLVEFHCNGDDVMISRPDISIYSCIFMVFVIFHCMWCEVVSII